MFENLSSKIEKALHTLKGKGSITDINVAETVKEVRKALLDADTVIAGHRAAIAQLTEQLSAACDVDKAAETARKDALAGKRRAATNAALALTARRSANRSALDGIRARSGELDRLEQRLVWLKALSATANGTLSGKEKVMLETYVQMTYFDRIIARANVRLMVMTGNQYELKPEILLSFIQ